MKINLMPLCGVALASVCLALAVGAPGSAQEANPVVVIETSMGDITVELDREKAPISVENFLSYASEGYYSGTIFHRVIRGFMIQGGGYTEGLRLKETKPPIENEATNGLRNSRGTLAMARTADVKSATSQFFINTVDNRRLDHRGTSPSDYGQAVFGRVTDGMDVVDQIERVRTETRGPYRDVPAEPVVIKRVRIKNP